MDLRQNDEHIIFKVCISCNFDTLQFPNRPRHRGPSCNCPECELYTFVIACSKCLFESSDDCPLTKLLDHKHTVHSDEEEVQPRGRPRKASWERKSREKIQTTLKERLTTETRSASQSRTKSEVATEVDEAKNKTKIRTKIWIFSAFTAARDNVKTAFQAMQV